MPNPPTDETATVCIPWRPSPSRIQLYECACRYWAEHFPDWPVVTADSDGEIFSLARARNAAVRLAKTEVVVISDADTVTLPPAALRAAVADPTGIQWPAEWKLVPPEFADRPFDEFPAARTLTEYKDGGVGSVMVCTTAEYWRLGGFPPEFEGWGHEDRAFGAVAATLSAVRRIDATAYSIEHNIKLRRADSLGWDRDSRRNRELVRPYENACGNPELMRELLKIRDRRPTPTGSQDWRTRAAVYETDPLHREIFAPRQPDAAPRRSNWRGRG